MQKLNGLDIKMDGLLRDQQENLARQLVRDVMCALKCDLFFLWLATDRDQDVGNLFYYTPTCDVSIYI